MKNKEVLQQFQAILRTYPKPSVSNTEAIEECFAIQRYNKKFEVPVSGRDNELHNEAWLTFLSTDSNLPVINRVDGLWYKVREELHNLIFRIPDEVDFPKGSEFLATRGNNSIEARLSSSTWTVTRDCFDEFSKRVYGHNALKKAFRKRFSRWTQKNIPTSDLPNLNKWIWEKSGRDPFIAFQIKLRKVVQFEYGSRFSTVPKNNNNRRPINIECFGNMIVQKSIGSCFRNLVLTHFGNDLSSLQDVHKERLVDKGIATIDLKNASDSISLDLVRFLFPKKVYSLIVASRSEMILGPDENYYLLRKVSSMGNGFTFELMTLILTSLCRVLDPHSSVYGDDIIIRNEYASRLISALTSVGFQVNLDKSFVNSEFRESCGGNYHDAVGYLESYDFRWPTNIHECIVFTNKAYMLKRYDYFNSLYETLVKVIPPAWQGPKGFTETIGLSKGWGDSPSLGSYVFSDKGKTTKSLRKYVPIIALRYQYDISSIRLFFGFRYSPSLRTPCTRALRSQNWAKYLMYLDSLSVCKDVRTGQGDWDSYILVSIEGRISTLASLLA